MPKQNVLKYSPDTCKCSFYIKPDINGNWQFCDYNEVISEQQARIDRKETDVNSELSPPANICDCHKDTGLSQALWDDIKSEQKKKADALNVCSKQLPLCYPDAYSGEALAEVIERIKSNFSIDELVEYGISFDKQTEIEAQAKEMITYSLVKWDFDDKRILKIGIPKAPLTQIQKNNLKAELDIKITDKKVEVL